MNDRCEVCGVEAYEGQEFTREGLFRKKLHCPGCLKRLYDRIHLVFAGMVVLLGVYGLYGLIVQGGTLSESLSLRVTLLIVFQWLLIFPHELGHALAARWFGFENIRILVGSGKPLVRFRGLGFSWVINRVPFGGLTLADGADRATRREQFIFVAGGPAVNLLAAMLAWGVMSQKGLSASLSVMVTLFLLANLCVLLGNLLPYRAQTPFGRLATDGLLLIELWESG